MTHSDGSSEPLQIGIIGCGNISISRHIPALLAMPSTQPVAVADPVAARREEALSLMGLPVTTGFDTHQQMLESHSLDYVVIAVPPSARLAIIEDCASAGVHVLAEKPIATLPAEGARYIELMQKAGLKFGMVHNYLYYPEYILLRSLIDDGLLGNVRHIALNFLGVPDHPGHADYRPRWRHNPAESGGGILMDMIHGLYVAEYLMGNHVRAVSAVIDNLDYSGGAVEDLVLAHLHFDTGYASVNIGWGHGPGGVEVTGSKGRVLCFYREYSTGPFNELEHFTLITSQGRKEFQPRKEEISTQTFEAIHQDFVDAIRDDHQPVAPGTDGLRGLEQALAAYASAFQGKVVTLPLRNDDPVFLAGLDGLRKLEGWNDSPLIRRRLFGVGDTENL